MAYNEFYIIKFFDDKLAFSDAIPDDLDGVVSVYKLYLESGNVHFEVVI